MSIEKSHGYKTNDGKLHASLAFAQEHELETLLGDMTGSVDFLAWIWEHKDEIADILRSTGRKPRQKKAKVGRPRKTKVVKAKDIPSLTDIEQETVELI